MKVEMHIAETTGETMTKAELLKLSLKIFVRRNLLLLIAFVLAVGYSVGQMNHREKVDALDARYRPLDSSSEEPAMYRAETMGTCTHRATT